MATVKFEQSEDSSPLLSESVESDTRMKEWLVSYIGAKHDPSDGNVTVSMIIETMSEEFPEFVMALAEENWIRGYQQAVVDIAASEAEAG